MSQPDQITFLHCSNPKCKWKVRYKGAWNSYPDFCPKCGWLVLYNCPFCSPNFELKPRGVGNPEPTLFENGVCRSCRAQSKKHFVPFLRRLLDELASASGFIAKDQIRYKKELNTSPNSFPFQMEEKLYSADEHKQKILEFYRQDCRLNLEEVSLFLRTTLNNLDSGKQTANG
jgi:hypothetical protein